MDIIKRTLSEETSAFYQLTLVKGDEYIEEGQKEYTGINSEESIETQLEKVVFSTRNKSVLSYSRGIDRQYVVTASKIRSDVNAVNALLQAAQFLNNNKQREWDDKVKLTVPEWAAKRNIKECYYRKEFVLQKNVGEEYRAAVASYMHVAIDVAINELSGQSVVPNCLLTSVEFRYDLVHVILTDPLIKLYLESYPSTSSKVHNIKIEATHNKNMCGRIMISLALIDRYNGEIIETFGKAYHQESVFTIVETGSTFTDNMFFSPQLPVLAELIFK